MSWVYVCFSNCLLVERKEVGVLPLSVVFGVCLFVCLSVSLFVFRFGFFVCLGLVLAVGFGLGFFSTTSVR